MTILKSITIFAGVSLSICGALQSCSGKEKSCVSGTIDGHDYVDLGLPSGLKWATCNVGATSPEEYGNYFAWGETNPRDYYYSEVFNEEEYWHNHDITWEEAGYINTDGLLNSDYDAAQKHWGGAWRTPRAGELEELIENTKNEWGEFNGVKGVFFRSKVNDNYIFLPATGSGFKDGYAPETYYWSSTPLDGTITSVHIDALNVDSCLSWVVGSIKWEGHVIRPVSK